ncbi:MAG: cobalt ECF transporter T component CbiQ [Candidatus Promineifilaceae bacterium]
MAGGHLHFGGIDAYAKMHSPIHDWDTRFKIVGLLSLIVAFALVQDWRLLPALVLITVAIYIASGLPWHVLRHRLTIPGAFIGMLVLFMPFIAGETVIAQFGPLDVRREGLELAGLVAVRFFCIVSLAFVMLDTDTFYRTIEALRALRFPDLMADMVLLTYRYLFVVGDFFGRMQTAARLRGFQGTLFSIATLNTFASLIGHMLIRSYDQSERVYKAMVLRGYGNSAIRPQLFKSNQTDRLKLAAAIIVAVALTLAQYIYFA